MVGVLLYWQHLARRKDILKKAIQMYRAVTIAVFENNFDDIQFQ